MNPVIAGIDLGGTGIKFGLFSEGGALLEKWSVPTDISDEGSRIIPDIGASLAEHLRGRQAERIGLALPGSTDGHGICARAVNLGWTDPIDAAGELASLTGSTVLCENDVNAAALGESLFGAGKGCADFMYIALGTGIGCGIIMDGRIYRGAHGAAGEIGHFKMDAGADIPCSCGNTGCVERYASANGIVRIARAKLAETGMSPLDAFGIPDAELENLSSKIIFESAASGGAFALEVVDEICDLLGRTIAAAAALLDPERIVIGGGMAGAGDVLMNRVGRAFRRYAFPAMKDTQLVNSELGGDAGIVGAAALVFRT